MVTNHLALFSLGDILDFFNGKAIEYRDNGIYPVYGSNGIIGYSDKFMYEDGVIIGRVGAYCGSVIYRRAKFWATDNTIVTKTKRSSANIKYIFYLFKLLGLNRYAGGSAQPLMTQTVLKQVNVKIPPLPIQRKIAAMLSAYDDLIENNLRRIKILEEMAQNLYAEWFVKFRFPGHEKVKMVDSPLGRIPGGWLGRLSEALVLQRGFDLPKGQRRQGYVPVYAATGIVGYHNEVKVRGPGIVTGRSGSLGTVVYSHGDFWPLNTSLWVKEFVRVTPIYAFYLLKSLELGNFNSGAAVPTLNRNDINNLPVIIPPQTILDTFDWYVKPIFSLKKNSIDRNESLIDARDLLLPKLISGELDVSALDIKTGDDE